MRSLLIAALILALAPQARAQDALPHFVFNGHRIGEPEAVVAASGRCKTLDTATRMCLKEGEEVAGMHVDVSYSYRNQGLSSLHVKVDSGNGVRTPPGGFHEAIRHATGLATR